MNEEFLPFELAKKLKEKGLKNNCIGYYDYAGEFHYNYESDIANKEICFCHNKYDNIWHEDLVDAPTISQVLKWLREEEKRFVVIHPTGHDVHYYYTVHNLARSFDTFEYTQSFATYEEAALAGIEYCLDNLI